MQWWVNLHAHQLYNIQLIEMFQAYFLSWNIYFKHETLWMNRNGENEFDFNRFLIIPIKLKVKIDYFQCIGNWHSIAIYTFFLLFWLARVLTVLTVNKIEYIPCKTVLEEGQMSLFCLTIHFNFHLWFRSRNKQTVTTLWQRIIDIGIICLYFISSSTA